MINIFMKGYRKKVLQYKNITENNLSCDAVNFIGQTKIESSVTISKVNSQKSKMSTIYPFL